MKNILTRNTKAIFDLSTAEGVDVGVARDMFASNLALYPELPHKSTEVDYEALSKEWKDMTKEMCIRDSHKIVQRNRAPRKPSEAGFVGKGDAAE